jgi:hypothetical protein
LVGVVLAALLGACEDEKVCPQGSTSQRGRCRPALVDGGADAFPWPPADTTVDIGVPPVIRPDASGALDAPDGIAATDGEGADGSSGDGVAGADTPAPADGESDTAPGPDDAAGVGADTP